MLCRSLATAGSPIEFEAPAWADMVYGAPSNRFVSHTRRIVLAKGPGLELRHTAIRAGGPRVLSRAARLLGWYVSSE